MGFYLTNFEFEPTANRRSVPVNSFDTVVAPDPHRGPKFTSVLSAKYIDEEPGLYYYGHRYYQPEVGRWASRDRGMWRVLRWLA